MTGNTLNPPLSYQAEVEELAEIALSEMKPHYIDQEAGHTAAGSPPVQKEEGYTCNVLGRE